MPETQQGHMETLMSKVNRDPDGTTINIRLGFNWSCYRFRSWKPAFALGEPLIAIPRTAEVVGTTVKAIYVGQALRSVSLVEN